MNRRTLLASAAAAVAAGTASPRLARAQSKTRIVFWHAMSGQLGEEVKRLCNGFNAAQSAAEIEPVFKGSYTETLTAAIAAWRAGQAPNLVQMFEVGTGSMLAAGPAVKQIWELIKETGVAINPEAYIPAVRGYYSLPDGRLASMPFNSSTGVVFYNKDAFAKAGLDPDKPPATWPDLVAATRALKEKSAAPTPMSTAWFPWLQLEQFAAMHDLPYATKANGFEGLDTELLVNAPPFVQQVQRFVDMQKDGLFRYAGRDNAPDPIFAAGEAAILFASSGLRGGITKDAKFRWGETFIPFDPALRPQPLNTVIGGASLWTMTAPNRPAAEYKGGGGVPAVHRPAKAGCRVAPAHRLRARDAGRLRTEQEGRLLREEPRRRRAGAVPGPRHDHAEQPRLPPGPHAGNPQHRVRRDRARPVRRPVRQGPRWTTWSPAATRCCGSSSGRTGSRKGWPNCAPSCPRRRASTT